MVSSRKVIVVGAGPVGAVMAHALRRKGVPVVLIEALAEPEIDCRAASCDSVRSFNIRAAAKPGL